MNSASTSGGRVSYVFSAPLYSMRKSPGQVSFISNKLLYLQVFLCCIAAERADLQRVPHVSRETFLLYPFILCLFQFSANIGN
jgi:hypothetical protein